MCNNNNLMSDRKENQREVHRNMSDLSKRHKIKRSRVFSLPMDKEIEFSKESYLQNRYEEPLEQIKEKLFTSLKTIKSFELEEGKVCIQETFEEINELIKKILKKEQDLSEQWRATVRVIESKQHSLMKTSKDIIENQEREIYSLKRDLIQIHDKPPGRFKKSFVFDKKHLETPKKLKNLTMKTKGETFTDSIDKFKSLDKARTPSHQSSMKEGDFKRKVSSMKIALFNVSKPNSRSHKQIPSKKTKKPSSKEETQSKIQELVLVSQFKIFMEKISGIFNTIEDTLNREFEKITQYNVRLTKKAKLLLYRYKALENINQSYKSKIHEYKTNKNSNHSGDERESNYQYLSEVLEKLKASEKENIHLRKEIVSLKEEKAKLLEDIELMQDMNTIRSLNTSRDNKKLSIQTIEDKINILRTHNIFIKEESETNIIINELESILNIDKISEILPKVLELIKKTKDPQDSFSELSSISLNTEIQHLQDAIQEEKNNVHLHEMHNRSLKLYIMDLENEIKALRTQNNIGDFSKLVIDLIHQLPIFNSNIETIVREILLAAGYSLGNIQEINRKRNDD